MKIGIYGGSFNPIHEGHVALGRWLVEQGYVEALWYLVSPQNPLKNEQTLLEDSQRVCLASLAVEAPLMVSDFECHLPKPSYMVQTLASLRATYPEHEFVLVIGADNWRCFHEWKQPEEILSNHRVLIFPRKGYEVDATTLPDGVEYVCSPLYELSATEIRKQIAHNPCYQGEGLPPMVWKEIQRKGFYRATPLA